MIKICYKLVYHYWNVSRMRVPKRPFVFFPEKYEILKFYSNSHSFLYSKKKKCYSCTQKAIRVFIVKCKILQLYPNGHLFFYSKIQNFENCAQTAIHSTVIRSLTAKQKFFFYPNGHFFF